MGRFFARPIGNGYGDDLPKSVGEIPKQVHLYGIKFNPKEKYDLGATFRALLNPLRPGDKTTVPFTETAPYSPAAYIPQSLGMLVGTSLGMPALAGLFLGRLLNLAAWIVLVYFAIRLIPFGKWALFVMAVIPMSIFMAASLSPDAVLNGITFLFVAWCLRLAYEKERLKRGDVAFLLGALVYIALTKLIYLPIGLLMLLIPAKKFPALSFLSPSRSKLLILAALASISGAIGLAWGRVASPSQLAQIDIINQVMHANIQPKTQVLFVLTHPIAYVVVLWNTFLTNNADGVIQGYLGILGWLDTMLPLWVMLLEAGLIIFLLLAVRSRHAITKRGKIMTFLLLGLLMGLAASALYAFYTSVKYITVIGLQGRYFIPIVVLLIPIFLNSAQWFSPSEKLQRTVAVGGSAIILVSAVLVTLFRYYPLTITW
jgi:uncharacterized membrane protein